MKKQMKWVVLVAALAALGAVLYRSGTLTRSRTEDTVLTLVADGRNSFQPLGKGFFQASKDGSRYYETLDTQVWNDTYTMTSPFSLAEGDYAAVAELLGRNARVYDAQGMCYSVSVSGGIMRAALSENGYLSLVVYDASAGIYRVQAYSASGTLRLERTEAGANVYPLACDVSDDGRVLAIAYFDGDQVEVTSKVCLFYINESDSEGLTDAMFAAVEYPGELVGQIGFVSGGQLAVVSDSSVSVLDSSGKQVAVRALTNEPAAVSLADKSRIVLLDGPIRSGSEGAEPGTLEWLDLQGNTKGTVAAGENARFVQRSAQVVVVEADRYYYGFGKDGILLWSYQATQDLAEVLPLDKRRALLATQTEVRVVDMTAQTTDAPLETAEPDITASGSEGE